MRDEKAAGCRVCGTGLPAAVRGRPPAYCSRSCQAKAYRRRRKARAADRPEEGPAAPGEQSPPPGPPADGARERRRRQVAEAVWRIAAARGLEAVSMREVAAEAGVSLRVVQYYFGSKHRLLVEALRMLHEENDRRARARMSGLHERGDLRAVLRAVLVEFLPLDEQRALALRVFTAYFVRSLADPAMAEVFLHGEQAVESLVADLIRGAGAVRAGVDPAREADLLVSGVTGLGMDVLHGRRTMTDVQATIDYHLDRILT
ncbi:TetR/AcrR family transcriptional regulator [Streptomyces albofaciens]|uniref:TetR/AcrR family transcriptional regulator n=1 Tax=Streptomyces albofaciens TaxID=66866 RepID=UPI001AD76AE9|nr:TetR/AcrR family transcriptional regulator [Streptomyces albofaciens]